LLARLENVSKTFTVGIETIEAVVAVTFAVHRRVRLHLRRERVACASTLAVMALATSAAMLRLRSTTTSDAA
jgi:hypothetical protein